MNHGDSLDAISRRAIGNSTRSWSRSCHHRSPDISRFSRLITLALMVGMFLPAVDRADVGATLSMQATPAVSENLAECTVQPRPVEDFVALAVATPGVARSTVLGTPVATPEPPSDGTSADPDTVEGVEATVRELISCLNAGDLGRVFALYSDNYLLSLWGGLAGPDPTEAEIDEALARLASPTPLPSDAQISLLSIDDVRVLPNGAVTAIVNLSTGSSLSVFVKSGDRYLLDWAYERP